MNLQNIPVLLSKDRADKAENNLLHAFHASSARSSAGWSQHAAQSSLQNGNFRSNPDEETGPVCVTLHKLPLWQARGKYRHTQPWLCGEQKHMCTSLISCLSCFCSFLKAGQTLLVEWFISYLLIQLWPESETRINPDSFMASGCECRVEFQRSADKPSVFQTTTATSLTVKTARPRRKHNQKRIKNRETRRLCKANAILSSMTQCYEILNVKLSQSWGWTACTSCPVQSSWWCLTGSRHSLSALQPRTRVILNFEDWTSPFTDTWRAPRTGFSFSIPPKQSRI